MDFHALSKKQKYCSYECLQLAQSWRRKNLLPREEKTCIICGAKFLPKPGFQKCCSAQCSSIHHKNLMAKQRQSPEVKPIKFEVPDEKLYLRIECDRLETFEFTSLRKAVNFLSTYTDFEAREVLQMIEFRAEKIGSYKIFYGNL